MTYFPKSQIKTNLYTNGGRYILSTTKELYSGYYYEISNGQKYTGKHPNEDNNILLEEPIPQDNSPSPKENEPSSKYIQISTYNPTPEGTIAEDDSLLYAFLTSQIEGTPRKLPNTFTTLPTPQNHEEGKMIRYFAKKTNELIYKEISKETYNQLKSRDESIAWDLYEPQKIEWIISNTPINFALRDNKTSVMKIEQKQKWYGFPKFLKEDYTKYWKS